MVFMNIFTNYITAIIVIVYHIACMAELCLYMLGTCLFFTCRNLCCYQAVVLTDKFVVLIDNFICFSYNTIAIVCICTLPFDMQLSCS